MDPNVERNILTQLDLLKRATDELARSGTVSSDTMTQLSAAINSNTAAQDAEAKATGNVTKQVKEFTKSFVNVASATLRAGQNIRQNRDSFESLNPAIRTTGVIFGATGKAAGSVISGLGEAVSTLSWFGGPITKVIGTVVGTGLSIFGSALSKTSEALAQMAPAFGEFATKELQNVVDSYKKVGSVGSLGAGGMTEMYDSAVVAGMSLKSYSDLVARNGQDLAFAAGNTYQGARQLTEVSQKSERFKEYFLRLGFTYEEQQEYTAKNLARNKLIGNAAVTDSTLLAESSKTYMQQLDEISRLTGLSRAEANKELEEQLSNVRFQAALREANAKDATGEVAKRMSTISTVLKQKGSQELAVGFQDAFGGMGTDAARQFNIVTQGRGREIIEALKSKKITQEEALNQIQLATQEYYAGIGGDEYSARAGKLGTVIDPMLLGIMNLSRETKLTLAAQKDVVQSQEDAGNAQDKTTDNVVKAQVALRNMAIGLDKIVKDKLLPTASATVGKFADAVKEFIKKALGVEEDEEGKVDIKTVIAADKAAQDRVIYESKEFLAWQTEKIKEGGFGARLQTGMYAKYGVEAYRQEKGIAYTPPKSLIAPAIAPSVAAFGSKDALTGKPLDGVNPSLVQALSSAASEYKAKTGQTINVTSAIRDSSKQAELYQKYITGQSRYPAARPGTSKHERGIAIDIDSSAANALDQMGLLAKYGLGRPVRNDPVHIELVSGGVQPAVVDEHPGAGKAPTMLVKNVQPTLVNQPTSASPTTTKSTGELAEWEKQIEEEKQAKLASIADKRAQLQKKMAIPQAASGGVFSGPKSGFPAVLHGTEAVVPLPNGQSIPVEMKNFPDKIKNQLGIIRMQTEKIEEIIEIVRGNNDINYKILRTKAA